MPSQPRTCVLLIGAGRAVPYPIASTTSEYNLPVPAAHGDAEGFLRLSALAPSSTADAANMVTPVDMSTPAVLTDMITPVDDSSFATTHYELAEITPVPVPVPVPVSESISSSRAFVATGSVASLSTTEAQILPNTITITDWVTVTLPEPTPNNTGSVTVPITVGPLHCGKVASRRPEMPGGILGGPVPTNSEQEAAQSGD